MARLFFAVWPGAAAARKLAAVGEGLAGLCGGKPVPAEKIHVTLAFLGNVDEAGAGRAIEAAADISGSPIAMTVDRVGSFRRAGVAWAAPSQPCPALQALQSLLAGRLAGAGFVLEDRAFNPHATLVRRIGKPVPGAAVSPVRWRSPDLTLVRSEGDGRYSIVESWKLG